MTFRHYLRVRTASHRKDLIQMVLGHHQLAVERLRWNERNKPSLPRERRLCRFCQEKVEDPPHALFECMANADLIMRRNCFMCKVTSELPQYATFYSDSWVLFRALLAEKKVIELFAKFAHEVLEIFYATEIV
ncbi:hypothetical protein F5876DRAFT_24393, partial [Lentinula aff. lateritia]